MRTDFLIVGAGPTGIGAALNLAERDASFLVVDAVPCAGGLARSVVDAEGFTWDLGGHVQFSHYRRFDDWMDRALGSDGWLQHKRESWIWLRDRFIPYPLQNNVDRLADGDRDRAVSGLRAARNRANRAPLNFREWIDCNFGPGLAEIFMVPYNRKVWAHPLETMSWQWVGERVAVPSIDVDGQRPLPDQRAWGPNRVFRYPMQGGTGAIWTQLAATLPLHSICLGDGIQALDATKRTATLRSGTEVSYSCLISTIPLDQIARLVGQSVLTACASRLKHSTTHVVGIGLEGVPPPVIRHMSWMYFPEPTSPFYRVTVFSNYSPHNIPRAGTWSLMAEVAESAYAPVDAKALVEDVLTSMRAIGLVGPEHRTLSRWHRVLPYGYPIPTLDRDEVLDRVLPKLEALGIYSRGRFGAWKYEVSNQDHSFMQGWECAERLSTGGPPEMEVTLRFPHEVNSGRCL